MGLSEIDQKHFCLQIGSTPSLSDSPLFRNYLAMKNINMTIRKTFDNKDVSFRSFDPYPAITVSPDNSLIVLGRDIIFNHRLLCCVRATLNTKW